MSAVSTRKAIAHAARALRCARRAAGSTRDERSPGCENVLCDRKTRSLFIGPSQDGRGFQLTLLGTRAVESGGSVGKFERNEQPLFRGESAGFVNLLLRQHVSKLAGTSRSIPPERQRCGCRFRFHGTILHGNNRPVTTQEDDCSRDAPIMMGTRSP